MFSKPSERWSLYCSPYFLVVIHHRQSISFLPVDLPQLSDLVSNTQPDLPVTQFHNLADHPGCFQVFFSFLRLISLLFHLDISLSKHDSVPTGFQVAIKILLVHMSPNGLYEVVACLRFFSLPGFYFPRIYTQLDIFKICVSFGEVKSIFHMMCRSEQTESLSVLFVTIEGLVPYQYQILNKNILNKRFS